MRTILSRAGRRLLRKWGPWLPCAAAALWLLGDLCIAPAGVELFHVTLAAWVLALGWLARRLWPLALVLGLLTVPLVWHFAVRMPEAAAHLPSLQGAVVRVQGTVRERQGSRDRAERTVRLLLGEAELTAGDAEDAARWPLAEVEVVLPADNAWSFPAQRRLAVGGVLRGMERAGHRLRLLLSPADFHVQADPIVPWGTEVWRLKLRDRSGYYLSRTGQAVYLPLVLDLRDRQSPEGREIITAFRRAGVSHLFAISGINVAMIFGLLMLVQRFVLLPLFPGQGWVHGRSAARLAIIAMIWAYIALIGFSPPAVRAALMGSMLIWSELWGTRTPGLYVLVLAGLAMLAVQPSELYDISFQLSFLAYFFLVVAIRLAGRVPRPSQAAGTPWWQSWWRQGAYWATLNLLVTLVITLGLWPLIVARFGSFSLLVFAGNLLLVPLMEAVLLPSAMVALGVSLAYLGTPPGAWLEQVAFGWLEGGLWLWLAVVRVLNRIGAALVFKLRLDLPLPWVLLYYAVLAAGVWLLLRGRPQRRGNAFDRAPSAVRPDA